MNVETAQRLADLRRSKGFSQEGLARKLGLSRQAVSKWERAESSPDTENLISLAKLYGVSLDELLNPSDEIEDDIEFENEDRARQREAEAAERARTHEAAARATEAATQASDAAAKAAQAASWSAQAANAATAQVTGAGATSVTPVKGPFQSFPYWAVCWLLFFLLMFLFGAGPFAALIFFTIPIITGWRVRSMAIGRAGIFRLVRHRWRSGPRGRILLRNLMLTWLPRPPLSHVPKKVTNDEAFA